MTTLPLNSKESDFLDAVRSWLNKAAEFGYQRASEDFANYGMDSCWTDEMITQMSYNHFDDDQNCLITTIDQHPELYHEVFKYDDDSGYSVDHAVAFNSKPSDFTLQVEFIKLNNEYQMFFRDIHIL
jgi:hypothetical protein